MPRLVAWSTAFVLFAICLGAIFHQRDYFTGKARLIVSDLIPDPEDQAALKDLRLEDEQRIIPVDWTLRIESRASMEAALRRLGRAPSGEDIERLSARVFARAVPGSTAIEVIVREDTEQEVIDLLTALIEAQQEIWVAPQRASTDALLKDLEARESRLRLDLAAQTRVLRARAQNTLPELTARLRRMENLLLQLDLARDRMRAGVAVSKTDPGSSQLPLDLQVSDQLEFERLSEGASRAATELAQLNSTYGPNNNRVKEKQAQLAAARDGIARCLERIKTNLERNLKATEAAADELRSRVLSVANELNTAGEQENSSDVVAASMQVELIKEQINALSKQRNNMLTYRSSLVAPLIVLNPPYLVPEFSRRLKLVQIISAFFGFLLVGFSLTIILARGRPS